MGKLEIASQLMAGYLATEKCLGLAETLINIHRNSLKVNIESPNSADVKPVEGAQPPKREHNKSSLKK